MAQDPGGNLYVTGTNSGGFPTTAGALQTNYGGAACCGYGDAFDAKIDISSLCQVTQTPTSTPTHTPTQTPSPTPTNTPTPTKTTTVTPTPTRTPTLTPTSLPNCDDLEVGKNLFAPDKGTLDIKVHCCTYPGHYSLCIYNSVGEHVRTLDSQDLTGPLNGSYAWDGKNKYGDTCASGIYLIRAVEPFGIRTGRVLLLR